MCILEQFHSNASFETYIQGHNGVSIKNVRNLGRKRVSSRADEGGQGEGEGLAVNGHPFQCGLCKRRGHIKVISSLPSCGKD